MTDFSPLRTKRSWTETILQKIEIPFYDVDAHNIVPCWIASPKREYAARTFRPKVQRFVPEFLTNFPKLKRHPTVWESEPVDWNAVWKDLKVDNVPEVEWIGPGEAAAKEHLQIFLNAKLDSYDETRNDPVQDGQSDLSPYIHFDQISAQRVALAVKMTKRSKKSKAAFLEELVVRRELADNFGYYSPNYETFDAVPDWAKKTLNEHKDDFRDYIYTSEELERAQTHDPLWNAAQMEMTRKGKMHPTFGMTYCDMGLFSLDIDYLNYF